MFEFLFARIPVPAELWSEYSGLPFTECIGCTADLHDERVHIVQKRIVAGEAVFEMALCTACRESLSAECSEATRHAVSEHINQILARNMARAVAEEQTAPEGEQLADDCLNHCISCHRHRNELHRYSLAGAVAQSDLIVQRSALGQTPLLMCEDCEREMAPLVSKQTRDAWDRFVSENFDGPPGVEIDTPDLQPIGF